MILDTIKEIVTSKELILTDKDLNNYFFENSKINLKINEIIAKDIVVDFEDSFFGNENNNPLLKGKGVTSNDKNTQIYKSVFST